MLDAPSRGPRRWVTSLTHRAISPDAVRGNDAARSRIGDAARTPRPPARSLVEKRQTGPRLLRVASRELSAADVRKRRGRPRVVLGLKDIPMSPTRARRSPLLFQTIEHYYDEVWVYGAQAVFDTVREHAFPAAVARKTIFCGYFDALPADDSPQARPLD